MKYLGLDLGSRTLGMAISDKFGMLATAYQTLRFEDDDYDFAINSTKDVIIKESIECVVLGYPKHMNGDVGIRGKISEDFKEKLSKLVDCEIVLWDERLTTMEVNKTMLLGDASRKKRKEKKDELAALVILQGYLDFKRNH